MIGDYSMKNIPIPSRFEYYKNLVHKIENFNRRIRWKAFFILNPSDKTNKEKETFGFKSSYSPPHVKELEMFEKDLYNLISSIEFRQHSNHFQKKLKNDVTKITNPCRQNPKLLQNGPRQVQKTAIGEYHHGL